MRISPLSLYSSIPSLSGKKEDKALVYRGKPGILVTRILYHVSNTLRLTINEFVQYSLFGGYPTAVHT